MPRVGIERHYILKLVRSFRSLPAEAIYILGFDLGVGGCSCGFFPTGNTYNFFL